MRRVWRWPLVGVAAAVAAALPGVIWPVGGWLPVVAGWSVAAANAVAAARLNRWVLARAHPLARHPLAGLAANVLRFTALLAIVLAVCVARPALAEPFGLACVAAFLVFLAAEVASLLTR